MAEYAYDVEMTVDLYYQVNLIPLRMIKTA